LKVHLIPVEDVSEPLLGSISDQIREVYSPFISKVEIEEEIELPSEAYDPSRDQYRAEMVLQRLSSRFASKEGKILGITSEDLYGQGLNFVFGQAQKPGKFALISLHRLKPEFWGEEKDQKLFFDRAIKEAVHELGHSFGLEHCENERCVMTFSNRIGHTDRKKAVLCKRCEEKIEKVLVEED